MRKPPSRSHDFLLLLSAGLPVAACASTVADNDDGGGQASVDAAIDACGPYAKKVSDCHAEKPSEYGSHSYLTALGYCVAYLGYADIGGADCRAAVEDLYACLAPLDCDELIGVDEAGPSDDTGTGSGSTGDDPLPPCEAEQTKVNEFCDLDDE